MILKNPNDDADLQSFMNHSETPNSDGDRTLKRIKKGEEITENYTKVMYSLPSKITKNHLKKFINY